MRQKNIELIQIDLKEMIDTILVITGHQLEMNDIAYDLNLPETSFIAKGDYTQIQQCLMNLIFNAIESMTSGGTLTLSGGRNLEKNTVWVSVADTGYGIDPEDHEFITQIHRQYQSSMFIIHLPVHRKVQR